MPPDKKSTNSRKHAAAQFASDEENEEKEEKEEKYSSQPKPKRNRNTTEGPFKPRQQPNNSL